MKIIVMIVITLTCAIMEIIIMQEFVMSVHIKRLFGCIFLCEWSEVSELFLCISFIPNICNDDNNIKCV